MRPLPLAILTAFIFFARAPAQDRPTFEVAAVKPAQADATGQMKFAREQVQGLMPVGKIPMIDKSRISLHNRTLTTLIAYAYGVRPDQISGPDWLSQLEYDVDATLPSGAPASSVNEMLLSLLESRFALHAHRESKEASGYALTVAKGGPKLTPAGSAAPIDPDAAKKPDTDRALAQLKIAAENQMRADANSGFSSSRWSMKAVTIDRLVQRLNQMLHAPVVDATGLTEKYDFDLTVQHSSDEDVASAASRALSPLGLKLESRKLPGDLIVVDSANRTPTEN